MGLLSSIKNVRQIGQGVHEFWSEKQTNRQIDITINNTFKLACEPSAAKITKSYFPPYTSS